VTEAEFQDKVVTLAKFLGWRLFHPKRAQLAGRWATHAQGDPGWPDLVLCHPKRGFIIAELKTDTGRVSPGQRLWLNDLEACDVECYIWRPKDWPAIEARLKEKHQ
jgi:hypothetical protein